MLIETAKKSAFSSVSIIYIVVGHTVILILSHYFWQQLYATTRLLLENFPYSNSTSLCNVYFPLLRSIVNEWVPLSWGRREATGMWPFSRTARVLCGVCVMHVGGAELWRNSFTGRDPLIISTHHHLLDVTSLLLVIKLICVISVCMNYVHGCVWEHDMSACSYTNQTIQREHNSHITIIYT